jgi:hypothetical protein
MKLTFTHRRIIAGAILPLFLVVLANKLFGLGWFGDYDRKVLGAVLAIGLVWFVFFVPSVDEVRAYRERKLAERNRGGHNQ